MLDNQNIIPLYFQLKEILKEKIKGGDWKEGDKVPSERELTEMFDVSRATAKKSLDELMIEGLIYRRRGLGTFVSKSKVEQNLIGELSFNQQVIEQGLLPSSKLVYAALEQDMPQRLLDVFQLNGTYKIYKVMRVRLVNSVPLILESLFIPHQYAPDLLKQDLEKIAVFEYLKNECNHNFTHSTLDIEPIAMNDFLVEHLQTKIDIPGLSLERTIYSTGEAIIIQKRIMRGDRGKYSLTLGEEPKKSDKFILGLEFEKSKKTKK